MTLETLCIIGSILGSLASVSAVLSARRTRTVARYTRGIEQIRRYVEHAIHEGC
jgi:hypothetical protein